MGIWVIKLKNKTIVKMLNLLFGSFAFPKQFNGSTKEYNYQHSIGLFISFYCTLNLKGIDVANENNLKRCSTFISCLVTFTFVHFLSFFQVNPFLFPYFPVSFMLSPLCLPHESLTSSL